MTHGTLWRRLTRGTRWCWLSERHRAALPPDLDAIVMDLRSEDRYHAKQGRSTCRLRFDSATAPLSVYLKRHDRLPWSARLGALLCPSGRHSPAKTEWAGLEKARALGIAVPEVVAIGERVGPWGALQSYLMVAELTGCRELNEVVPELSARLDPTRFASLKRELIAEMAQIAATLHRASVFHKDFYLCHFFLDPSLQTPAGQRLTLIDLHRLREHRLTALRWRWKDLGELLFSTYGVAGIDDRDRLRFWKHYRKHLRLWAPRWQMRRIRAKAARYWAHNATKKGEGATGEPSHLITSGRGSPAGTIPER
ncbi:MAG: lipopolysaccharide kinase [Isosphaeraceae bacterium]|nr:lipopolysaccharide kinase [Isosphaeraceae bacterium]